MKQVLDRIVQEAGQVILGKEYTIRLAVTCLIANGHLLIEDLPGVGKTTLAHVLAKLLGLDYQRIQFTSDLLPADILGASIYSREDGAFHFHKGPLFSQLVLADEINRATPKSQSALLEAMEERQITIEGKTRQLPSPFFVIATQNPAHQIGTFALPESQLDRFLMRIQLGYPTAQAERQLLEGEDRREMVHRLETCLVQGQLRTLQAQVGQIHISEALLDYVQLLLQTTRSSSKFSQGLSPRAGLALINSARSWALLDGRDCVLPEDVQAVLPSVVDHRLQTSNELELGQSAGELLIQSVTIP